MGILHCTVHPFIILYSWGYLYLLHLPCGNTALYCSSIHNSVFLRLYICCICHVEILHCTVHLFLILCSVMPCVWFAIGHNGSIYTVWLENAAHQSFLPHFSLQKVKLATWSCLLLRKLPVFFSSPLTSVLICKACCTFKSRLSKPRLAAHHLRIAFAF